MIKYIYTFFLGLLLATFVGVGISTFYPSPKEPTMPDSYMRAIDSKELTAEQKQAEETYLSEQKTFQTTFSTYNRNVSLIALVFSLVALVIALGFAHTLPVITDGLLLGGVFTLLYSIGRGLASEDPQFRFIVTTVGLIIALVLGYLKFIRAKTE